jgi:predicted cupin superfamily sugar epimerase
MGGAAGWEVPMTLEEILSILRLAPHPAEGGYFAETYRSAESLPPEEPAAGSAGTRPPAGVAPSPAAGSRSLATAIYYLMTPGTFSALHRLSGDEIFHFYLGDPVEMLHLLPDGSSRVLLLGTDLRAGMRPQVVVPRGVWQGSRVLAGGKFALLGTTMSPGFDYSDYEAGDATRLLALYPEQRERILALTRRPDRAEGSP